MICRYKNCLHKSKEIDTEKDDYQKDGRSYYHTDCYKTKCDVAYIKNYWRDHINPNVMYSQLTSVLNDLIFKRGNDSSYVVFVIEYCVKHNFTLRYPPGIKYYIDNKEIRNAYEEKTRGKRKFVRMQDFASQPIDESKIPSFVLKKKCLGFGSILGGD